MLTIFFIIALSVGDMMSHDSRELKLGHTAEVHFLQHVPLERVAFELFEPIQVNGHLAARNIAALLDNKPLLSYPEGVVGAKATPKIFCLSLGESYILCARAPAGIAVSRSRCVVTSHILTSQEDTTRPWVSIGLS